MELDIFFVKEKVLKKELIVKHVPSLYQIADILRKPLASSICLLLKHKLNVSDVSKLDN